MSPDSNIIQKIGLMLYGQGWLIFAALGGALTSLAFLKPLTWQGRLVSIMVSGFAVLFLAPAIIEWFLPHAAANNRLVAAIYYLVSATVMSAFPPFLSFAARFAGDPLSFIKIFQTPPSSPKPPEDK